MRVFDYRESGNPIEIFQNLTYQAYCQRSLGEGRDRRRFISVGYDALPDELKPGGLIRKLSEKDRKILGTLTSDMTSTWDVVLMAMCSGPSYLRPTE